MSKPDVAVVGGGWAGLAAATRLVNAGVKVILFERAKELGGRASSFYDAEFGEWLDNGPHVFISAYTSALALLKTWGVEDGVSFEEGDKIPFIYPNGREVLLHVGADSPSLIRVSEKLRTLINLLSFKGMSTPERLKTIRALNAIIKINNIDPQHEPTIADFLRQFGIETGDCGGFWETITVAVMNAPTELAGIKPLAVALKEGLLAGRGLGVTLKPFQQLYIEPAKKYLAEKGVEVRTGVEVKRLLMDRYDRIRGLEVIADKFRKEIDRVVCCIDVDKVILAIPPPFITLRKVGGEKEQSLPPRSAVDKFQTLPPCSAVDKFQSLPPRSAGGESKGGARDLLPNNWQNHEFFNKFSSLKSAVIASVHLTFDKPVLHRRFAFFPGGFTHWVFGRGEPDEEGWSRISTVTSYAPGKDEMTNRDIQRCVLTELRERLPYMEDAQIRHIRVIRTMAATTLLEPGSELIRPTAETPIGGLYLAGDWCRTGLPVTIESAARSGEEAARRILEEI